jgi:hypothetical protein
MLEARYLGMAEVGITRPGSNLRKNRPEDLLCPVLIFER